MTDKTNESLADDRVMLFREGNMIQCGPHFLDYVIVWADDVAEHLGAGWFREPAEAAQARIDADLKAENDRQEAALRAQILANQQALENSPDYQPAEGEKVTPPEVPPAPENDSQDDNSDTPAATDTGDQTASASDNKEGVEDAEATPEADNTATNDSNAAARPARRTRSTTK